MNRSFKLKAGFLLALLVFSVGSSAFRLEIPLQAAQDSHPSLKFPIGITTTGEAFTELIPADTKLPASYSDSFTNSIDNQKAIAVTISQKRDSGTEKIVSVAVDVPPRPKNTLHNIITINVNKNKELRLKISVSEANLVKEYGPFSVE